MRLLVCFLFSFQTLACDWSTIKRNEKDVTYSNECHLSVGTLVKIESKRKEQVSILNKSLELKDLALNDSEMRTGLWKKEAEKQNIILQKHQQSAKMEKILWFATGAVSVLFGAWAIKQVR